jgi:hypothetical protein
MRDEPDAGEVSTSLPFSKRAARRMIQRAFVLLGRNKHLRQHIREAHLTTLWVLEDWNFVWTVIFDRGRIEFERRPAKKPDLAFTWRTAGAFLRQVEEGSAPEGSFELAGNQELRRFSEPLLKGLLESLRHVLRNPVDDVGESLL